jgi:hypothetical protein
MKVYKIQDRQVAKLNLLTMCKLMRFYQLNKKADIYDKRPNYKVNEIPGFLYNIFL